MKKLVFIIVNLLLFVLLIAAGCTSTPEVAPGEEASTCVKCHSDKGLLKEVASLEPEEEKSEATSGEG